MGHGSGLFVTFEGGEGAGKSTQLRRLAETLRARGHDVVTTREPGGSPGAEAVRHVVLSGAAQEFGVRVEAMLFAAARSDHVEQLIRPALSRGAVVLCDRFMDSSRVYQGITGNLDPAFVESLERVAINGVVPDCTIIFDLPAAEGWSGPAAARPPTSRLRPSAASLIASRWRRSTRTKSAAKPFSISQPPSPCAAASWMPACR